MASAESLVTDVATIAPWLSGAVERWSGVLAPFRTKGESNLIHPKAPGRLFDALVAAPGRDQPVVVFTTIGWDRDGLDMARVQDIGTGTAAVRVSMTAVPGLAVPTDVLLPWIIAIDPPTLTFWDDEASLTAWAHRQPSHKRQIDRYRQTGNADRASFTRLTPIRSDGTWYGIDPVAGRADTYWARRAPSSLDRPLRPPDGRSVSAPSVADSPPRMLPARLSWRPRTGPRLPPQQPTSSGCLHLPEHFRFRRTRRHDAWRAAEPPAQGRIVTPSITVQSAGRPATADRAAAGPADLHACGAAVLRRLGALAELRLASG